jgi:dihydroorotate dehydrogenase (NAD+) catalytic subunit
MVKLSPNVTDIRSIARSAEEAGADVLSLINTLIGMAVNLETRTPRLANITGGLSGPAIKPIALRMVWEVYNTVSIPVVGIGGICNARDALEFIIAGASAIQIGTGQFVNPQVTSEVIADLENYLKINHLTTPADLVGTLETATGKGP